MLQKVKKIIRSKSGESIMEALVSLLILGILMTTIVSIIRFSMVMTGSSISEARDMQDRMNAVIHEDYAMFGDVVQSTITITSVGTTPFSINVAQDVDIYSSDEDVIVAFKPR